MIINRAGRVKVSLLSALLLCLPSYLQAQTTTSVEDLVKSLSNDTLKVETRATPYKLTGDFNGDRVTDVAVIVSLENTVNNIGKAVKIEYPYYSKDANTDSLALFIIHGKGKGWQFAQHSSVLFLGSNPALIFQKERLDETGSGMQLLKSKRGTVSIIFPTEASDGILKWNGRKYTWSETEP